MGQKNQKSSCGGLVLAREVQAGLFLGSKDPIRVVYAGIEVQGGHDGVRHKGGLVWAKKQTNIGTPTQCLQNIYD